MTKYQKEIESLLFNYEKDLDKKLYKAYAHSLREIKREIKPMMDNIENLNYTQRQKLIKDVSLQLQIEQQLEYLSGYVTDNTYKYLNQTGELAYNGLFYEFEQLEGFNTNFTMLPTKTIEAIVQTPVEGLRFSERIQDGSVAKLRSNFEEVFRTGFTKGISYDKMAKRLSDVSMASYKRSMTIARTEGGRVQAVTRQMSQVDALELGIETEKQWVSTLDGSTRDSHRDLDGQRRQPDEYFEINGHKALQPHMFGIPEEDINCRCRTILVLKGYDHKLRRDNEKKKVIKNQSYQEWAESHKGKPKRDIIKMSDEDRLKFLKNEMNKIENEDWGGLSEDDVSDLYDKYEAEYFELEDRLASNSAKDRIIQNTDKFFNDQGSYLNWKNKLTGEDKISIRKYTGAYYEKYNNFLRQTDDVLKKQGAFKYQTSKSTKALKDEIDNLITALDGYVPEYDFSVYRGMTGLNDLLKVGETQVIDKGFMSSSVYKNTGKSFAGKEDSTLYKINIKKGSSVGNYVSEFSEFKNEKEFLIKPGTKFKVVDIKTVKENGYTKQIVELETI